MKNFRWIMFVAARFAKNDRRLRRGGITALTGVGIFVGVAALIIVLSVMRGFQMSFVDAIVEVASFHAQIEAGADKRQKIEEFLSNSEDVVSFSEFYEAKSVMVGKSGFEAVSLLRFISEEAAKRDKAFMRELNIISGTFDFSEKNSAVLGSTLANRLGVWVGDEVNILLSSGTKEESLFSSDRKFKVRGIFETNYSDINEAFVFLPLSSSGGFVPSSTVKYGVKLKGEPEIFCSAAKSALAGVYVKSWREFNSAFYGTLRVEKNVMMILIFMIFVVASLSVYNSMKRSVFEKAEEIAVFYALGAEKSVVKMIFIFRAVFVAFCAVVSGTLLGLLVSRRMSTVFMLIARLMYIFDYVFTYFFNHENLSFVSINPVYRVYAEIPARVSHSEVAFVAILGFLSPLSGALKAASFVSRMKINDVLRDE